MDGERRIVAGPPLVVPVEDLAQGREREEMFGKLHQLLRGYRQTLQFDRRELLERFRLVDFARNAERESFGGSAPSCELGDAAQRD